MEIKLNHEIIPAANTGVRGRVEKPVQQPADSPSFDASRRLDATLAEIPDVRPEVVERATALVQSVQYPPVETMHKIARLLAMDARQNPE